MTKTTTQSAKVLYHLQNYGSLTALEALELFHCFRLAARINDLKKAGHDIQMEMKKLKNGKKVAEYFLPKIQKQGELKL
jgi:hypothetical protein